MDHVSARGQRGVPHIELKWDFSFQVSNNLRLRLGRPKRHRKNQGEEQWQQHAAARACLIGLCISKVFLDHSYFSSSCHAKRSNNHIYTLQLGNARSKVIASVSV